MTPLGEAPFLHVGDVFAEGGDALRLQAAVLGGEIAVSLGMAGRALLVVAEDVVRDAEERNGG